MKFERDEIYKAKKEKGFGCKPALSEIPTLKINVQNNMHLSRVGRTFDSKIFNWKTVI